jgi:16S rRNA (guanine527-N7)-methyltransferase
MMPQKPIVIDSLSIFRIIIVVGFFWVETSTFSLSPVSTNRLTGDGHSSIGASHTNFAMDATSETATRILRDGLNLSPHQQGQLEELSRLSFTWNQKVNLMSRRQTDSTDVIFGRHVLPSLAPLALLSSNECRRDGKDDHKPTISLASGQRLCDVGTGGGFPGLPLAIARPDLEFLLIDSVGKKIKAVQDMADQLGLTNVQTFHGRAEEFAFKMSKDGSEKFDWVVGRSVAAIPTYCYWIQDLLKEDSGHLVYLIGGDIEQEIISESVCDEAIEDLLECPNSSDKRVLCFPQKAVRKLASASGERPRTSHKASSLGDGTRRRKRKVKGEWTKRDTSSKKRRGYENFQRFDSLDQ